MEERIQKISIVPEEEGPVNNMPADLELHSADWLLAEFGKKHAYAHGVQLAIDALKRGDRKAAVALGHANVELINRGYHRGR
jgi:hypothetical protein